MGLLTTSLIDLAPKIIQTAGHLTKPHRPLVERSHSRATGVSLSMYRLEPKELLWL